MKKNYNEILSVKELKIGYVFGRGENVLLNHINCCAKSGELIALIGRNGIGKSTLLRTLARLQKHMGGEILLNEKNIVNYSRMELAQEVGYISTEIINVSNMTVLDMVSLGRFPHTNWIGKMDKESVYAISQALANTSMENYSGRLISELSDGERQRAMIARLLAQDTEIMILDEPTAFLDIGGKYEILHLLSNLAHNNNKTLIFSTHDMQMAISHADKIWLIIDDKLIEGAPEDHMIAHTFDHLFDSSPGKFDPEKGSFCFNNNEKGSIYLEGGGKFEKHWTGKALKRAGFSISEKQTIPYITITGTNKCNYLVSDQNSVRQFESVYGLIRFLSNEYSFTVE